MVTSHQRLGSVAVSLLPEARARLDGDRRQDGPNKQAISKSVQPKRECRHAMSSVCTTAEPAIASCSRPASVLFPLELRPSTASTPPPAARSSPRAGLDQGLSNHRQRLGTPRPAFRLLGSELQDHEDGLPDRTVSRAYVTPCLAALLPALSAAALTSSAKIIPCISRALYHLDSGVPAPGTAAGAGGFSGRRNRSRTGAHQDAIDAVNAGRAIAGGEDGFVQPLPCFAEPDCSTGAVRQRLHAEMLYRPRKVPAAAVAPRGSASPAGWRVSRPRL